MAKPQAILPNSKPRLLAAAALGLVATYIFASLAVDTAKYLYYLLALVSFVVSVKFIVRSFKTNGKK